MSILNKNLEGCFTDGVITGPMSVCVTPLPIGEAKSLDPEVVAFAEEHGIEITDEESYQYACHEFDKVYDAGEV